MGDLIRKSDADAAIVKCKGNGATRQACRDAIAALPAVTVRVKPLVWEQADAGAWLGHGVEPCQYYLRLENDMWWHPGDDYEDAEGFDTPDAAKAAAQRDYEARILAALEPVATTLVEEEQK